MIEKGGCVSRPSPTAHDAAVFDDWTPRGVVFDCDGLLVDTEPCWTLAEAEMFLRRGMPFRAEHKRLLIGKDLRTAATILQEAFDEPGRTMAIAAELETLVGEVIADHAEPMPGAQAIVELASTRVPIAVASNSSRRLLDLALHRGGFADAFAVTVARDEAAQPKPAPDLYLRACAQLHIAPARALAFEDSPTGMRAAIAAGMRLISIPTLPRPEPRSDWVLPRLDHPALLGWITRWPTPVDRRAFETSDRQQPE